ncbi:ADP-ribosylation factor-like protein 16 isoform X2 [Dendropsophus ebraccatus]
MVPIWPSYYKDCQTVLFIVDAANINQVSASCIQLLSLLSAPALSTSSVLVVFNKTMPSCIVKGCRSKWRTKDPNVVLHSFPWDPERIRVWLQQIQQFSHCLEEMVQRVLNGKVNDSFRLCSLHFTADCYRYEEDRRILRKDSVPTIFQSLPPTSGQQTQKITLPPVLPPINSVCASDIITSVSTATTAVVTYTISQSGDCIPTGSSGLQRLTTASSLTPSLTVPRTSSGTIHAPPKKCRKTHHIDPSSTLSASTEFLTLPIKNIIHESSQDVSTFTSSISQQQPCPSCGNRQSTPEKRDFATNTVPFMFRKNKGIQVTMHSNSQKIMRHRILSKNVQRRRSKIRGKPGSKRQPMKISTLSTIPSTDEASDPLQTHESKIILQGEESSEMIPDISATESIGLDPISSVSIDIEDTPGKLSLADTCISTYIDPEDTSFHSSDCEEQPDKSFEIESEDQLEKVVDFQDMDSITEDVVDDQKFIVFESCLVKLLRLIPCQSKRECNGYLHKYKKKWNGSMLSIAVRCSNGHVKTIWESQPKIGTQPAGNIILSAATLLSGNSFLKVQQFLNVMKVKNISGSTFLKTQKDFVFPGIAMQWQKEQETVLNTLRNAPVYLTGDGQLDSPSFSTKYCTYALMDADSKKIVSFCVQQLLPTLTSVGLQKITFKNALEDLLERNLDVCKIATDRHVSIRELLQDEYPHIEHQLDTWHVAKSVGNKIVAAAKSSTTEVLMTWVQPLKNHLWWCARTCGKDPEVLLDRWKSVLEHVTNVHAWESNSIYLECDHPPLTEEQLENIKWLQKESPAHDILCKIVHNDVLLKDIRQLSSFCHTEEIEIYHNMCLKYRPKRINFLLDSMVARTQLAAIDHNRNVGRISATVKKQFSYDDVVETEDSKARRAWVVKEVYELPIQDFLFDILKTVVQVALDPTITNGQS